MSTSTMRDKILDYAEEHEDEIIEEYVETMIEEAIDLVSTALIGHPFRETIVDSIGDLTYNRDCQGVFDKALQSLVEANMRMS